MNTKNKRKSKIGILGGMGPQASCELVRLIIAKAIKTYGAFECDEFPEMLLDSIPVTDFISDTDKIDGTRIMLVERTKQLIAMGCNPIVMACNSAHVMEPEIRRVAGEKFISLIQVVSDETKRRKLRKVCVFATPTTINNDLYGKVLRSLGIAIEYPDKKVQKMHERIIRNVISGMAGKNDRTDLMRMAANLLSAHQVDGVILGCTELPVATGEISSPKILNSLEVLADNLLATYYNAERRYI